MGLKGSEMRVGISTLIVRPGRSGSNELYLVNLINALAGIDGQNEYLLFVTPQNRVCFEPVFSARFRPVVMPSQAYMRPVRMFLDQFAVPIIAASRGVDVLHFPGTIGSVLPLRRPRSVVTVHYYVGDLLAPSLNRVNRLYFTTLFWASCRAASRLIVPSETFKQHLSAHRRLPESQLCMVYHGVRSGRSGTHSRDRPIVLNRYRIRPGYLLSVTNSLPHKNLWRLVEAFMFIKRQRSADTQLVLIGDVEAHTLRALGAKMAGPQWAMSEKDIVVTGFLPHDEVMELYTHAFLVVNPTLMESASMTVLEGLARGVPVVASDIPVHREILGDAALLVDPLSSEAIADACLRLLNDAQLRSLLIQRGLERAASFTWERTARNTLAVYQQAASDNGMVLIGNGAPSSGVW